MIGLENWFINFGQFSWKDVTPETLADVQRPHVEYALYCTFKCAQVASFVGGLIVHPAYRFYLLRQLKNTPETTTSNSRKIIRNTCRRLQGRILLASLAAGPLVSLAVTHYYGWDELQVKNRCYQIRINSAPLVHDRATAAFGLIGWYWKRFQGAVDGINFAILYTLFYFNIQKKYTNPILVDNVKPEELYPSVEVAENNKDALTYFLTTKEMNQ